MRNNTTERPMEPATYNVKTEYDEGDRVKRAEASSEHDFPNVASIHAAMKRLRKAGTRLNDYPLDAWEETFYGPPEICVIDREFNLVHERLYHHSPYEVEEMVEIAKAHGGSVHVEQNICASGMLPKQDEIVDEGYSLEIWPRFRVRPWTKE